VEGYSTFRRCGIDLLVAGRTLVTKERVGGRSADLESKEAAE
jgi:hypothetical protein